MAAPSKVTLSITVFALELNARFPPPLFVIDWALPFVSKMSPSEFVREPDMEIVLPPLMAAPSKVTLSITVFALELNARFPPPLFVIDWALPFVSKMSPSEFVREPDIDRVPILLTAFPANLTLSMSTVPVSPSTAVEELMMKLPVPAFVIALLPLFVSRMSPPEFVIEPDMEIVLPPLMAAPVKVTSSITTSPEDETIVAPAAAAISVVPDELSDTSAVLSTVKVWSSARMTLAVPSLTYTVPRVAPSPAFK
jgi:hypothetical protein